MLCFYKEEQAITKILGSLLMYAAFLMPHGRNTLIHWLLSSILQTLGSLHSSPALQRDLRTSDFESLELLHTCIYETNRQLKDFA